ncbi:MAG: hypothetical protein HOC71_01745, partial [Candidatus Latescibacteria bacterium]|nr:hypothetical protein [Candidatus Latescibacterota bacterium]
EADKNAIKQAMGVVVLSSFAAGLRELFLLNPLGVVLTIAGALGGWFIWAYIVYLVGTKLLPEPQTSADHGELLRTIGFSSSPGLLRIFGVIPGLFGLVNFIAAVWMLVAMIVAVRQALDYTSTLRAVGVCFIGWIVQMVIISMLFIIL